MQPREDLWLLVKLHWNLPCPRDSVALEAVIETMGWIPVLNRAFWEVTRHHEQVEETLAQFERELDYYFERVHNRSRDWLLEILEDPHAIETVLIGSLTQRQLEELEQAQDPNERQRLVDAVCRQHFECTATTEELASRYQKNLEREMRTRYGQAYEQ